MMRRLTRSMAFRRAVVVLVIAGLVPLTTVSCYGTFPLTNSLYKANGNLSSSKWVRSIVFFVLGIFGVYGICILVDAIILNLIEFWSGNDIEISQTYSQPDGSKVSLQTSPDRKTLTMTITKDGQVLSERHFVRGEDGQVAVQDADGNALGSVTRTADGGFTMENAASGQTSVMTGAEVRELRLAAGGR